MDDYDNVVFSNEFYEKDDNMIKYITKDYLSKIDIFVKFYNKYDTKGCRIVNGVDIYEESKLIFDNIISGDIYIDEVFMDPDNHLRNIVMLLHLDEYSLKNK